MIQRSDVEHVAKLARLKLSDDEIETFTQQLGDILDYVHKLEKIDTENVQPTAHVLPLCNVFREDKVKDSLDREIALSNAPEKEGAYFKTPKILESE
ncbi:asparaginyl/glutamyl-tRNA amidotransferase subunit C [Anoxybacter fermentans]|uniref:Aspartyl/glutamyl-tRNA(Asn/Gln) amidotransferase subunit C n=1 Tax=Anoxybacter fermentans TaxID=1323375 RepID=A0A3S9SUU9_9FIRM|nr:Asp-tRNA(Asn)/Glu-tRNA(Gln) amidotransferase subunit GatC [Anoxybacter fermentans]AZR72065.1 asparaginyl/glutamyl-tRNA amidotransferase subunit C [Anoxybacter fermentans]